MIRFIESGHAPKSVCSFDRMTAGDVFAQLGESEGGGGGVLTVNGRSASSSTPVQAGDTVALQPAARNG